ncbi:MAG: MFS transporter [Clostridia bacterium]|nr:MFS transporter [Clostridia bacterium]
MKKSIFGYNNKRDGSLFLLCWIAYTSTYICRLNFSAIIPELTSLNIMSESRIATISSVFFVCYGVGQLFSGIIGDKLNTRIMVFSGVLISSVCNILIFFFHSFESILVLWAFNGIVQSLVWTPILKIASVEYDPVSRDKFGINMSTTVPIGTVLSYALSLVTLLFLEWNYVFLVCGSVVGISAIIWFVGTAKLKLKKQEKAKNDTPQSSVGALKILKICLTSGVVLMLIPIMVQGTLKDSVTQWTPEFFSSQFNSSTTFSLALTMVLPIVNVTGAFIAKRINKKINNELKTSVVFFLIAVAFLLLLRVFAGKSAILSLICMAGVTNCMFAINVMLITIVPLHFSKHGIVSTVGGILNATAYMGCAATNLVAGKILDNTGNWNTLFIFWIALGVIAAAVSLTASFIWKKNRD